MINVSLEGINDAAETLTDLIIPWRRKNIERKAKLENVLKQAEIQQINSEILMSQAKTDRERAAAAIDSSQAELIIAQAKKTEAESLLIKAQAEKTLAEAEKEKAELKFAQIELAMKIIDKYALGLSEIQKIEYVTRLLPVIDQLAFSDVLLKLVE